MSGLFVGFIVVGVIALAAIVIGTAMKRAGERGAADESRRSYDREDSEGVAFTGRIARWVGLGLGLLAVVLLGFSFSARVSTNKVGIVTSFGKPVTALSNGWHGKSPWQKMVQFDGAQQPLGFGDGAQGEKRFPKAKVRLAGNATADISGIVTWQMRADTREEKQQAVELFRQFRTFERVRDFYVWPNIQTALGEVFADFNPLVEAQNLSLGELNTLAESKIRAKFGGQLQVVSVLLRVPDYDENTDRAIEALQQEKQRTETAKQKEKTNQAESQAAAALATAQSTTPSKEVLINKCLDIAKENHSDPGLCFLGAGTGQPLISVGNKNR